MPHSWGAGNTAGVGAPGTAADQGQRSFLPRACWCSTPLFAAVFEPIRLADLT